MLRYKKEITLRVKVMPTFNTLINNLLYQFIETSKDGYAIFDHDDKLIYSNYVFRDIFCLQEFSSQHVDFETMIRNAYQQKRGINIDTDDIGGWLKYVETVRRKRDFRIFEVDLVDGRWMLFSEQMLPSGELLVQTKDISRQKIVETELQNSVQNLHKLALTDELTQIANRRCFVESVENELSRCMRNPGSVTMLLIDLDHFKKVNDTYGHPAGDKVLKHVAETLKKSLRQYDILGRMGGEEFAIFLGANEVETAAIIAKRILKDLSSNPISYEQQHINISASIGMTTRDCTVSFEQLYLEADEALYQAKDKGRNRVEKYST
jgi:diguanylate cyclase (GGDEF)-like protein